MTHIAQTIPINFEAHAVRNYGTLVTGAVLRRSAIVALVLGSLLALANQFPALFGSADIQYLPLSLVYLTPFAVVTVSQVLGIRQAQLDAARRDTPTPLTEPVLATLLSHGIPGRAVYTGLAAGSVTSLITLSAGVLESGTLTIPPLAPLAQSFILPILFGLLSQTIAYRKARVG